MRKHLDFSPKHIRLEPTKQKLTTAGGLGTLIEAFDGSPLKEKFETCLPDRVGPRSKGAYRLGLTQLASFIYGHDCLRDLDQFRKDPGLKEIMCGETPAPRTMGDFLRDFEGEHLEAFNKFLSVQAKSYRVQLQKMLKKQFKPKLAPHLSIDSTDHIQSGLKMEGLAYNYKGNWCLDSQVIFDELGFCWDMELRPGNTGSGVGASEQILRAFKSYKFSDEKYLSGDSAYCNQEIIKTCLGLGVTFTFTANHATTGWEKHIPEITEWVRWEYTEEEKQWAIDHEKELSEVELGRFYWRPSWNDTLRLPIKHFPCQRLKANHAFGQLAMVAHNTLRWVSIHDRPDRPRFAKGLRQKFIYIPGKIVSHARTLTMRIPIYFLEEVNRIRMALQLEPCSALATGDP